MTVSSEQSRVQYATDGVATSFPVPFRFLQNRDLRVTLVDSEGNEQELSLDADYSVTGAGQQSGGTLTTAAAYPADQTLLIDRIVSITQETAYQRNDPFPERAHERALDKLTMICQQLASIFGMTSLGGRRVLMVRDSDGGIGFLPLRRQRANHALGFDANGDPVAIPSDLPQLVDALERAEAAAESAEEDALSASQDAATAAIDADRAEAAADAATLASGLYPDTNTIINGGGDFPPVPEGHYATTPSQFQDGFLDLYRVVSGTAVYIDTYPNREAVEKKSNYAIARAYAAQQVWALPNADYYLTLPTEVVADRQYRIIRAKYVNGSSSSLYSGEVGHTLYPFCAFGDDFHSYKVDVRGAIVARLDGYSRFIAYPYRFFADDFDAVTVDVEGGILPTSDGPTPSEWVGAGPMYVRLSGSDLRCVWQHGEDQMLRVRYLPNGHNSLFNWRSTEVAPLGDPANSVWQTIHAATSDCWPPYVVRALQNGDGSTFVIYTGGNHGSNSDASGLKTARMTSIAFWVDGRRLLPGEKFEGYANCVDVQWVNEIMAYNTITLGRYVLEQKIRASFKPGDVSGFVCTTALEEVHVERDNGPQFFWSGYDTYHFLDGEQEARLPIPTDGSTLTSGVFSAYPSWATVLGSDQNGFHGVWMDRGFEAGDGRFIRGTVGAFRKGDGGKFYSCVVSGLSANAIFAPGESYEWHGGYFWAPPDAVAFDVDCAITFHRRGIPQLGFSQLQAGDGRLMAPPWAVGKEVLGVGVIGINGLPVTATSYSASFNEIKE
ncbi:hypothetical protein HC956_05045 [Alcaligenes faecalis]|uniref:Uncharacterized protein n=1 Tax=Alcaligenes ammonioxydans TaxID=2582914 RepID=A0ABX8SX31_9BURK|nr:hypothetical protein [Alcaligenes ammonioxydans]QXX78444.1 hypothetical protein FE795_05045 [Alcaligenes ammonioxydans]